MNCYCFLLLLTGPFAADTGTYDRPPFPELEKYAGMHGKVLSVSEQQWTPLPGTVISDTLRRDVAAAGLQPGGTETVLWDSSGRPVSHTIAAEAGKKKMPVWSRRFYYREGRLDAAAVREEGQLADSVAFRYNRKGQVIDYRRYDDRRQLAYKVTYTYKEDRLFMVRKKNRENFPVAMIRYRYEGDKLAEARHFDEQQQLVEIRSYSSTATPEGHLHNSSAVKDAAGNLREGSSRIVDGQGHLLELNELNGEREVVHYYRCRYNAYGLPEEEEERSASQSGTRVSYYLYDARRNWIRRDVFTGGKLSAVFLRTIGYAEAGK